jgi:hypothetical protein
MDRSDLNGALRDEGFLTSENLTLMCFTFNCNGKDPDDTASSLFDEIDRLGLDSMPDMICVGLQEMVALNAQNVLAGGFVEQQAHKWLQVILRRLNEFEEKNTSNSGSGSSSSSSAYEVVAHDTLVGLWICLFASKELRGSLKEVSIGSCATGIGGVLGNKGGVAVRFQVLDSTVCIVNSHLAAHREHVAKRNEDFHTILYSGMFPDPYYESMLLEKPLVGGEALAVRDKLKKITRSIESHQLTLNTDSDVAENAETMLQRDEEKYSAASLRLQRKEREAHMLRVDESGAKRTGMRMRAVTGPDLAAAAAASVTARGENDENETEDADGTESTENSNSESDEEDDDEEEKEGNSSNSSGGGGGGGGEPALPAVPEDGAVAPLAGAVAPPVVPSQEASATADRDRAAITANVTSSSSSSSSSSSRRRATTKTSIHLHTLLDERHQLCPDDHDIIVWMGDLNYRLDKRLDDDLAFEMIEKEQFIELSEWDQLQQEREGGRVFEDFNEGLRLFQPSYKFDVGTLTYVFCSMSSCLFLSITTCLHYLTPHGTSLTIISFPSLNQSSTNQSTQYSHYSLQYYRYDFHEGKRKKRAPAWCDRILWRNGSTFSGSGAGSGDLRGDMEGSWQVDSPSRLSQDRRKSSNSGNNGEGQRQQQQEVAKEREERRQARMKGRGRRNYHADFSSNGLPCDDAAGVTLLAYVFCYTIVPPSFLVYDVCLCLCLSYPSITAWLLALFNTTLPLIIIPISQPTNQSINTYYPPGTGCAAVCSHPITCLSTALSTYAFAEWIGRAESACCWRCIGLTQKSPTQTCTRCATVAVAVVVVLIIPRMGILGVIVTPRAGAVGVVVGASRAGGCP